MNSERAAISLGDAALFFVQYVLDLNNGGFFPLSFIDSIRRDFSTILTQI